MATPLSEVKARMQQQGQSNQNIAVLPQISVGLTTLQGFELSQRAAKLMASSSLVPKEYQGNIANCVIALNMASRIGADPLMVCQNLYLVHGRPSWSAQFLIATFNTCGRFSAIRYEFFGEKGKDSYGCRAYATELATGEKLVGTDVTIAIAKSEGWFSRNGSKWQTMPQQMLQYRAASWFVRTVAPELSMGLHTAEEMHDVYDAEPVAPNEYVVQVNATEEPENVQTQQPEPEPEIHPEPAQEVNRSNAFVDWELHISEIKTKAQVGKAAHEIRADHRLSEAERDELIAKLKAKQEGL